MAFVCSLPPALALVGLTRGVAWAAGRPVGWADIPFARLRRVLFDSIGVFLVVLVVALFAHSRRREFAADDHSFTRLLSTHPPTEERIARLVRRTNYRR